MARNQQLTRWLHVMALLRAFGGVTLARLASETGVTTRTIRRDLEGLQAAGVAIYDDDETGRRHWRMVKGAPCILCGRATMKGAELRRELNEIRSEVQP